MSKYNIMYKNITQNFGVTGYYTQNTSYKYYIQKYHSYKYERIKYRM